MRCSTGIAILLACFSISLALPRVHASDALPKDSKELIALLSSREFLADQRKEIKGHIAELENEREVTRDNGDREDINEILAILRFIEGEIVGVGPSERELVRVNSNTDRILTALFGEEPSENLPPPNILFRDVVMGSLFGHGLPLVPKNLQNKAMGGNAANESIFLHNPAKDSFFRSSDLAKLTPNQIADLDIGPDHPAWLSKGEKAAAKGKRIAQFEGEMTAGLNRGLRVEGDIEPGKTVSLDRMRRVLFLDEVYQSATSPKAETEDAYGVEWKLKWGDEPAVEPVATRLYLLAGARETDLVFASGLGREGVTLILNKKGATEKDEEGDDERHAETVDQLKEALYDFYGFDLTPYIYESGTITSRNISSVLRHLPPGGKNEYRPSALLGRQWVTFRESGVELKPESFVLREDGAQLSDSISLHDRVARGLYLFDLWIENGDVKDDNRKAFFRKGFSNRGDWTIQRYAEGHHDLGVSLGGLFSAGNTNRLRTGEQFASKGLSKLRFKAPLLFKPDPWKNATWSDGKWMARHIASISVSEIREAVAASLWPDFVQEVLVYRLVDRRNKIAGLFGVADLLDQPEIEAPGFVVSLQSISEIARIEKLYGLPLDSLKAELEASRGDRGLFRQEVVVENGRISSSENSALVRALTRHRYPSGLAERYRRKSDKNPPGI